MSTFAPSRDPASAPLLPSLVRDTRRECRIPASFAQESLWFLDRLGRVGATYNIMIFWCLSGTLDVEVLRGSLKEIVRRHESLRTRFTETDGEAIQIIDPPTDDFAIRRIDISHLELGEREIELSSQKRAEVDQPFDLESGPLFRATLLKVSDAEHVLLLTMHHIIFDGVSVGIIIGELSALYNAYASNAASPLPEPSVQYADYAVWQREWLQGEALNKQLAYWRTQLQDAPATLELPTDRPRPSVASYKGALLEFEIPEELLASLVKLARAQEATLYMVLLGAFQILLGRWSGQNDVVVGSPVAGRGAPETENIIGFFVNTLALRANLEPNPSFSDFLKSVKKTALDGFAHQDLPFEKLVAELKPTRDLSRQPITQASFAYFRAPESSQQIQGVFVNCGWGVRSGSKFDITLDVVRFPSKLLTSFEYATDLFDPPTIERLAGSFLTLLNGIVDNTEQHIFDLPLLTEVEQNELVFERNKTVADYPLDRCVHELFVDQAKLTPQAVALIHQGQELSYEELDRRSNQLAHHLQSLGVGPDVIVGLHLERSFEMIIALLAVLKAGGAYLPLAPDYPTHRLNFMLADAKVEILVTHSKLADLNYPKKIVIDTDADMLGTKPATLPNSAVTSQRLAYVIYTSGSTGNPKGVMIQHSNVVNYLNWAAKKYKASAGAGSVLVTALSFDATVTALYLPLISGNSVSLPTEGRELEDVVSAFLAHDELTLLKLTPAHVEAINELCPSFLGKTRALVIGGEALSTQSIAPHREKATTALINEYGPTEATVGCCVYTVSTDTPHTGNVPIGRPIENTSLYALDQRLHPVPIGVVGELYIGGAGLARGYLNQPGLSAERFIANPFSNPGTRMYRTGDLVRWTNDGELEFIGRADNQIKLRGYRIELGEIESRLKEHPAIRDAVVILHGTNDHDKYLAAYVVTHKATGSEDVSLFLRSTLPHYMMPSAVAFVERIPLTSHGKVDRAALASYGLAPNADANNPPATQVEDIIGSILSHLLKVEQIGLNDNFFAVGGHSLLALRAISAIGRFFAVRFSLREFFDAPTVRNISERVELRLREGHGVVVPKLRTSQGKSLIPASFAQERLWFLNRLGFSRAVFNMPVILRLEGDLSNAALTLSLKEIVRRHESLRTRFTETDGEAIQIIDPPTDDFAIRRIDISHLELGEREIELSSQKRAEVDQPFDLESGPLFRATLLKVSDAEHVLLLTMHHIISDGWSVGVVTGELSALYNAYASNAASPLPEPSVQYADYAVWQREWLQGEALNKQLAYWRTQLQDAPATLELPTDRPRPSVASYKGALLEFEIPEELLASLVKLARAQEATLYMVLLGAFQILLGRWSGQNDVVVGSPVAGRGAPETENIIGFFVNTLALRANLEPNPSFSDFLKSVKKTALDGFAHQDLPFEKLVAELKPTRDLSRQPITQASFAFEAGNWEQLAFSKIKVSSIKAELAISQLDLTLFAQLHRDRCQLGFRYATDLFDPPTIERLAGSFLTLLNGIVDNTEQHIFDLPLLTEVEQNELVFERNKTVADYPLDRCVHELFVDQAKLTPQAVALIHQGQELSYEELDRRSNQLAHHLQSLGVGPDVIVGLHLERSFEMIIALLAVLKAGGAYLPLAPDYPTHRLNFMLADAKVEILVTHSKLADLNYPKKIVIDTDADMLGTKPATLPNSAVTSQRLAYVIYTSGSTGNPKGVMIQHSNVVNYLNWAAKKYKASAGAGSVLVTALSFDATVTALYLPLISGNSVSLPTEGRELEDVVSAFLAHDELTLLKLTPAHVEAINELCPSFLGKTRALVIGGEALSTQSIAPHREKATTALINEYGPTEATVGCCVYTVSTDTPHTGNVPIGRPIENTSLYALDQRLHPVPIGVVGELYIGGAGLARGYLNQPGLSAERFIANPFSNPGTRMYRTGDLVRWTNDGELEFIGRADNQIKLRGYRIELGEIESRLKEHPAIRDAVVILHGTNDHDKYLAAYVVTHKATGSEDVSNSGGEGAASLRSDSDAELRASINERIRRALPQYMQLTDVNIIPEIPLTPNGKVDRTAFALKAQPKASPQRAETTTQLSLIRLWAEVVPRKTFLLLDNFFAIGGHSLSAIRLVAKIQAEFEINFALAELFKRPTILEQAEYIELLKWNTPHQGDSSIL